MIKKGTVSHEVLMTIVDNPMTKPEITDEICASRTAVGSAIKHMTERQGVKIQMFKNKYWIDSEDMPEFGMYSHDKIYLHILEFGGVKNSEISKLSQRRLTCKEIAGMIRRVKEEYGVKLTSGLVKQKGRRSATVWRIAE
jgi:biotin operon repressor